jgi:aryl-alcohol dehydrogenase-like predicted oxidoreductase
LEETFPGLRRCRCGGARRAHIGVSEWTARAVARAGRCWRREFGVQLISNQPRYSELWRVIEADVVTTSGSASLRSSGRRLRRACSPARSTRRVVLTAESESGYHR